MTWPLPDLKTALRSVPFQSARISSADAQRQYRTVAEILERLAKQPGLVLADEVGMGKTFVALGVALITARQDRGHNPVVVMIPPSLQAKWPRDAEVFATHCLAPGTLAPRFRSASTALEFFRLLDDPPSKRVEVIFLHHGAFHLTRIDHWTKLALLKRAMSSMKLGERRTALPRFAGDILRVKSSHNDPALYARLLSSRYEDWLRIINSHYAEHPDLQVEDDPVPASIIRVLERRELALGDLRDALSALPARESANIRHRLDDARGALRASLADLWPHILKEARFRSPLLVLDEAHHVKNPGTRLASLFAEESRDDVDSLAGAFSGRFERMLFLTATPFQLGHSELVEVLKRFRAVEWKTLPTIDLSQYDATLDELSQTLDTAQQVATEFDRAWQRIPTAVAPAATDDAALDNWWNGLSVNRSDGGSVISEVLRSFDGTRAAMSRAEALLKPWIIRHRRSQCLPDCTVLRRLRRTGRSVTPGEDERRDGLQVTSDQLLPFLLAARAQSVAERLVTQSRERYLTFSEGLASSYEAFLETSRSDAEPEVDDRLAVRPEMDARLKRYLDRLQRVMPAPADYGRHPKMHAVVQRVVDLWGDGEKVVVFCHYRKTGHALVRHISAQLEKRLWRDFERRTGIAIADAPAQVQKFGDRFYNRSDKDSDLAEHLRDAVAPILYAQTTIGQLVNETDRLQEIIRRFVRSAVFVARYFDPSQPPSREMINRALDTRDGSGIKLIERLGAFIRFYASRDPAEREQYLDALERVQSGMRGEHIGDGEDGAAGVALLPNVRLANGATKQDARQRLMLSFNTPFFPDVLVASSVLAEGVDLHLNCRHMIHHDLSWNPSDIEQRTGRVDRLGSKAESVRRSVEVFLPFVAETQDEKQFRVVTDRERWFQVLMGEDYRVDDAGVEQLASRIPLPPSVAHQLAFELSLP
jgi:ERCC4-related helicase